MKPNSPTEVPIRDQFELDFPDATAEQRETIGDALRQLMAQMRELLGAEADCGPAGTCQSCAFHPSLETSAAFMGTAYGFLWAVLKGKHFLCHSNQPRWSEGLIDLARATPCVGFRSALTEELRRRAVTVALRTQMAIEKVLAPKSGSLIPSTPRAAT